MMSNELLILVIGAILGAIGTIIATALTYFFNKKSKLDEKYQREKEERYLCLIVLMIYLIDFDSSLHKLQKSRPNITSKKKLLEEIEQEYYNMILFASENVLLTVKEFVNNPSNQTFIQVGLSMRKDLWGIKTNKNLENLLESN